MATTPNKFARFWQELKRRKVLRSLAIYAGSAFIILEASSIIFPLWNFPAWSINLVLWLLILGAFINVIIAWIYDITPGGMQRTRPVEEVPTEERMPDSRGWKAATYISLVVIVALIIFNVVPTQTIKAGDIQSLLILPFDNFTGDDQLDYVAAGMHAALIGDMGKISALGVISKTTASVFKTKNMSLSQIAKDINMEAVVEPSLMSYGDDTVCVQIRLITMYPKEKQRWIAEYMEDKSQILNLYNRITKEIANDLMIEITPREEQVLSKIQTVDKEAYDSYLKGGYLLGDLSPESLIKSRDYLNRAIEKDPDWAPLYAGLAQVWGGFAQGGYERPEIAGPHILENLNKALELDPDNAESHKLLAYNAFLIEWNWEKAETAFLKALAANPNHAEARIIYAQLLNCLQRNEEALAQGRLAIELDPLNPLVQIWFGAVLAFSGDFKTALAYGEKVTADDPGHLMANNLIENAAFACGEYDKAMEAIKYILPVKELDSKEIEGIYGESGFIPAYEEMLHQLEVLAQKEYIAPTVMAGRYMMVNRPDKAMEWLEKGYEAHDPNMPYIATHGYPFEPLFDNPRFIEILQKMNLPPPTMN
jgi:TolB-like protein/cytochrome c-type biogenesis protein CcmH/NrfG